MSIILNGSAGVTTNSGAVYDGISSGTAIATTSGTSIDFTGIPSWVKRITVMVTGVSTSGTSLVIVQLGTASGIEATGYLSASTSTTTGYTMGIGAAATDVRTGAITINLMTGNTFIMAGVVSSINTNAGAVMGSKTLSTTLDRIRLTTVNGTDTFDAGTINIMYE